MSSIDRYAPFIESFLAHRTGLFYSPQEQITTDFSLDPSTGGEPVFEAGQLLFQQISSCHEDSIKLKTLFLATPNIPENLREFLKIFRVFISKKDAEGSLQLRPFCFNHYSSSFDPKINPLSEGEITTVFDLLAEKGIPRSKVLILDEAFFRAYEEKKKTLSREEITRINSKAVDGSVPIPDLSKTRCLILENKESSTEENTSDLIATIEQRIPELTHLLIIDHFESRLISNPIGILHQRPLNKMLSLALGLSNHEGKEGKSLLVLNMPNLLFLRELDPDFVVDFSQSTLPHLRYLSTDSILETMTGCHLPKLKTLDLYVYDLDESIDLTERISDELASHLRSVSFDALTVKKISPTHLPNPIRWRNLEFITTESRRLLSQIGLTASQIEAVNLMDCQTQFPKERTQPFTAKSIKIWIDDDSGPEDFPYEFLQATEYLDLKSNFIKRSVNKLCQFIEQTPETAEIHLSGSICPNDLTEEELTHLQTLLARHTKVKWDLESVQYTGTRPTNPLDFSPDLSTPLEARYVFQTASQEPFHPRLHLQEYAKLDSSGRIQNFTIPDSEWIVIDLPPLKPLDTENPYLGRVNTSLLPSTLEILPNLPEGRMTSINLPEHTHLLYHPKTNRYAVKMSPEGRFQAVQIEWTQTCSPADSKQRDASSTLMTRISSEDSEALSSALVFQVSGKKLALLPNSDIHYLAETLTPLAVAILLAQWINGFHPRNAKTSAGKLAFHDHLNLIIQRRSGRCTERATLFITLMQTLRPELECFYLSNDIHAMAGVVIEGITHIFDLGGAPAQLEIQPLPEPLTFAELTDDMADELPPKEKPQIPADTLAARLLCEKILLQQTRPPLSSLEPSAFAFNTDIPSGGRPKNLCLEVQKAEWIGPVVQAIQRAGETSAYIFTAPSLLALSGTTYDLTTLKPKASPFQEFLSYAGEKPRVLILPSPILMKAQGPSSYYPLLDAEREINGLIVPPDVTILVVIDKRSHRNQREDFDSRFEPLSLDPTLSFDGMAEAAEITKKYPPLPALITSQEAVLFSPALDHIFYLDKTNFKKLETYEEITPSGLARVHGFLDSPAPVSFWIPQDLRPHQWEKLQALKASGRLTGQIYVPESLESPYVEKTPFFNPESLPILESADWAMFEEALKEEVSPGAAPQAITYLKQTLTPGDIPPESLVLAVPRLGNPFVRYLPQSDGSFIAEFTELFARLQQASTEDSPLNLILHGPVSLSLQSQLHELSHGQAVIAGQPLKLGSRTRLTIIETDASSSVESAPMTDSEGKAGLCRIIEGRALRQEAIPAEFRFTLWLKNFDTAGIENRLTLSAFDLVKYPFLQDIVRSLIASQDFMFEGKIYRLGPNVIEVIGVQLPKEITVLAQAFSVYQRVAVEPAVAPIFPETSPDALRARIADWKHPTFCLSLSRAEFLAKVDAFLSLTRNSHPLFLVEGASGIGKSALLRTYFNETYPDRFRVISPGPQFLDSLSEANFAGQIVLIDELNTFSKHELEALEALVQNQPNVKIFATQNPISFSGRKKLSEGLLQHAVLAPLPNYTQEELAELAQFQGLADERAESIAAGFTVLRESRGWTPRDFFKLIKSLNQPSATAAPQEAFAFGLNAKKTARHEASTSHSKLGKIRP